MTALAFIPLFPLLSFAVLILVGKRLGKKSAAVSLAALACSALLSVRLTSMLQGIHTLHLRWDWMLLGDKPFSVGLVLDPLSATMCLVVTIVGFFIALYSVGYMAQEERFSRFFAYLSLFFSSMLLLVLADHLALLYIGWELVGLCSYLLISFWFEKPAAAAAGKKAFLTTRVGDLALLAAILLMATVSDLSLANLQTKAALLGHWGGIVSLLIFLGACGKSAQFPLHVWLPDAMEGPTPVSALIHAATMVAAGVYLIARTFPLFAANPETLHVVLWVAAATSFFAATIAAAQTDLKKILAYSTISQLGFMMLGLGCGSPFAGMFHLVTHAWFKALLFLGAGSVIHAVHHQEITRMGGLSKSMPITTWTFVAGSVAMAGIPPFSGFWSKEEILAAAASQGLLFVALVLAISFLTSFYITRAVVLTFFGAPRGGAHAQSAEVPGVASSSHSHESPTLMTGPLLFLALGAAGVGLLGSAWSAYAFQHFLGIEVPHASAHNDLAPWAIFMAAAGILLSFLRYGLEIHLLPSSVKKIAGPLRELAANKYYIDELYERFLIAPLLRLSHMAFEVDTHGVDAAVNGAGRAGLRISRIKGWIDRVIVDGIVNAAGSAVAKTGGLLRLLQTGLVQNYLLITAGSAVTIFLMLQWK